MDITDAKMLPWLLVNMAEYPPISATNNNKTLDNHNHNAHQTFEISDYHGHHLHSCSAAAIVRANRETNDELCELDLQSKKEGWNIALKELVVVARLGEGSTSEVFAAQRKNHQVAIKVLKEGASKKDFVHEVWTARSIGRHPSLVEFMGVCTEFPVPIAVFEFLAGGTLDDLLRSKGKEDSPFATINKKCCELQSISWMKDMLSGLDFLHSQEPCMVHRDVKPSNLFLSADKTRLFLGDFGLCRDVNHNSELRCMTGVSGSLRYMAPEVFRGAKDYDHSVDIWSAGMVMWAAFVGVRPFDNMEDRVAANLVAHSDLRPDIARVQNAKIGSLITRSLSFSASDRPSARAMLEDLRGIETKAKPRKPRSMSLFPGPWSRMIALTRRNLLRTKGSSSSKPAKRSSSM
eukprot:CAMPEP_0181307354 /NCGR_PEP_ID=MMETSP1101-20121128/10830_1 /TAXON_ID=46948 /ORGANISM="Rhodomonas abbreviata, Strain Caron Lab Isolate" /LENGTH=404 /DNA_ID=CAMNT_0023413555 /DNA_START=174 /DNA_END=1391 /DNA_ORIENTATION=-